MRSPNRPALPALMPPPSLLRAALAVRRGVERAHGAMTLPMVRLLEQTIALAEVHATATFAELGVADHLADGPRPVAQLARLTGCDAGQLDRLLRFLATRGVVARNGGAYELTPLSDLLRTDHPDSLRDWVLFQGSDWQLGAWQHLTAGITDADRTPFETAHGRTFFEHTTDDARAGEQFDAAMRSTSRLQGALVAEALDLVGVSHVCDIGGGTGSLLARILQKHAGIRGTLLDLPDVVERARPVLAEEGVVDRVDLVGGDMFASVPAGADRYLLSAIVHDWPDEDAVRLLRTVRAALVPGARAVVVELELPEHDGAPLERAYDLLMLVLGGGRERTRAEFEALYAAAGLRVTEDVVLGNGWHAHHLAPTEEA